MMLKSQQENGPQVAKIDGPVLPENLPENHAKITGHHARRKTPRHDTIIWDSEVPGFGIRLRASGSKSWIVKFSDRAQRRFVTLGKPSAISVRDARAKAKQLVAATQTVGLPCPKQPLSGAGLTFAAAMAELLPSLARRWKPSTVSTNAAYVRRVLIPFFGDMPIATIQRSDVARWRDSLAAKGGTFNRAVPVLSIVMQEAEAFGFRKHASNPCKGIARYKRRKMERFLSMAEYRALGIVLREVENEMPQAVALLRLLIATGARVGEINGLRWEWVKEARVFLPDSKTGAKVLYLNAPARAVLDGLRTECREGLIFPAAHNPSKPINITSDWHAIRQRAGLGNMRLHDLRHSFASLAIRNGISLTIISRLLGHALPETTERYAHLADDSISEAADRVCSVLAQGLGVAA
ncbi:MULTISPECIES: tyrosine-type recombinase/integrase [unclassified Novosphingobium]|uniref:tyrosine-type recombinase/integrase n=1 Tax=unclassified Novosphingobium TaxID=2644732 RepID=UPI000B329A91|nr:MULTISPECIES: site-specific integrase [unclassified Novosphingobium]MBN9146139.1 tyrosine-type recombinase/integrase [Novosphingobium sp.]